MNMWQVSWGNYTIQEINIIQTKPNIFGNNGEKHAKKGKKFENMTCQLGYEVDFHGQACCTDFLISGPPGELPQSNKS